MTLDDIQALACDIRQEDAAELAAAGLVVAEALDGMDGLAVYRNGLLLCLFGVRGFPNRDGLGIPWMMSTNALSALPRKTVIRMAAGFIDGWKRDFAGLVNLVHAENTQAIRLIRWLGFEVDETPAGPGGAFFFFKWGRVDV